MLKPPPLMMSWGQWKPVYESIAERLGLDPLQDRQATHLLDGMLSGTRPVSLLDHLHRTLWHQRVIVCGAGPSLDEHLKRLDSNGDFENSVVLAADGATGAVLEAGVHVDVVVSDLDGGIDNIREAQKRGALVIIHAHGDNREALKREVPILGNVLGSTQVEPTEHVFLWGGFTDGDRACYVALHHNPKQVILAGMDFGSVVGRWSKPGHDSHYAASERKRIKLEIARHLISELFAHSNIAHAFM